MEKQYMMTEAIKNNLSINVLSLFENDKQSRIQVKVWNKERELSKFYFITGHGEEAVEASITAGISDFLGLHSETKVVPFEKPAIEVKPVVKGIEAPAWDREVPPPIPEEVQEAVKEEIKAKKKASKKTSKKVDEDEMEEVPSPYKKYESEESGKSVAGKVIDKVKEVVNAVVETPHIKYDINKPEHKSTLASYLTSNHAGWQTSKPREEIKHFSQSLNGKPFLSIKGEVLDSFKEELASFFG